MADLDDVRRIARSLPGAVEGTDRFGFGVENKGKVKGFCWSWKERVDPRRAKVENLDVLAVRVDGAEEKQQLLDADPARFFTEPHYNGYPAVLVRLENVSEDMLRALLLEAWRCMASPELVAKLDGTAEPVKQVKPTSAAKKPAKRTAKKQAAKPLAKKPPSKKPSATRRR
jgi:hypothetical protein